MFRLLTFISLLLASSVGKIYAQELSLIGRGNLSIGLDYRTIDFFDSEMFYSPGGGTGLEAGIQVDMGHGFAIQSTVGYQLNLAFQIESFNGQTDKSTVHFNRKFVSVGAIKGFPLNGGTIKSLQFGSGISFNWPGTFKRLENNIELGESTYKSAFGIYFEAGLRLEIWNNTFLDPAIRYRQLDFSADSFSLGATTDLPDYLQKLNANGIELGVTIVRKLSGNQE